MSAKNVLILEILARSTAPEKKTSTTFFSMYLRARRGRGADGFDGKSGGDVGLERGPRVPRARKR